MSSDKQARFRRLAELRGNRVIHDLRLISNLANKNNYSYTDEEVRALFKPIEEELKLARQQFKSKSPKEISFGQ